MTKKIRIDKRIGLRAGYITARMNNEYNKEERETLLIVFEKNNF